MTAPAGYPLAAFRFRIALFATSENEQLCAGQFSEVSGIEATMEPKTIREGGRNWGQVQRVGLTSFATVILRRGMTTNRDLWKWFSLVNQQGGSALRLTARLAVLDEDAAAITWVMDHALPVKFKAADLNATATQVAIEELQFVHQGLRLETP